MLLLIRQHHEHSHLAVEFMRVQCPPSLHVHNPLLSAGSKMLREFEGFRKSGGLSSGATILRIKMYWDLVPGVPPMCFELRVTVPGNKKKLACGKT